METRHSTAPTVRMIDPRDLIPHNLNRAMPRIKPGMPEWEALFEDVRERGITNPLQVVSGRQVVDGWTRREVAMSLRLAVVPVVDVPEDEGVTTLVEHLVLQKHLTKGQRAYLSWHLTKGLEAEKRSRRAANLKRVDSPMPIQSASGNIGDFAQFCERFGFSRDTFEQARTLHSIFNGDPSALAARNLTGCDPEALRKEWEPKILDLQNPVGLGAALAGMAGAKATEGKERQANPEVQLELFTGGVAALDRVAKSWTKIRTAKRPEIVAAWTKVAAGWPEDLRIELAIALVGESESGACADHKDTDRPQISETARERIAAAARARWSRYVAEHKSKTDGSEQVS